MVDQNRIEGGARELGGKAQGAAGNLTGDAKMRAEGGAREAAGKAQGTYGQFEDKAREVVADVAEGADDAYGKVRDAAGDAAQDAGGELARLRAQVEDLMRDRVRPALSDAAAVAGDYADTAKQAMIGGAERATSTVREQPLTALAVVGVVAFILGRLTADRD